MGNVNYSIEGDVIVLTVVEGEDEVILELNQESAYNLAQMLLTTCAIMEAEKEEEGCADVDDNGPKEV